MKKLLLTLLAIVLIVGILAGVGFVGYRFGYLRGAHAAIPAQNPQALPRDDHKNFSLDERPFHEFSRGIGPGLQRHFDPHGFSMPMHGHGFGFFSPLHFLIQIAIFGLIIWLAYKLLTGWRINLVRTTTPVAKVNPRPTETDTPEEGG